MKAVPRSSTITVEDELSSDRITERRDALKGVDPIVDTSRDVVLRVPRERATSTKDPIAVASGLRPR